MSRAAETPESPETAPESGTNAGTATNQRKGIAPLRKPLAAAVVGAFLLTGAAFASHGFTENPVDVVASQIHDAQASSGILSGYTVTSKGGLGTDGAKAVSAVKTEPVAVPVSAQHKESEQYGTVSIPRLGADWHHFLVEGAGQEQLDSPGDSSPDAVQNYITAVAHNTGTQNLGEIGNVGLEAHRTPNTFLHLDSLQIGDTISITEAKSGTVYTYAVTQTIETLPYVTPAEQDYAASSMDPIPFDDASISTPGHLAKNQPTKRLLTMTSCGADYATTHDIRVYVQAELRSVTPAK